MNTSALSDLYRTDHPKFTTYRGDGSGRDCHVIFQNGGLNPNEIRKLFSEKNHFNLSSKVTSRPG